jgi:hypothetical protein
MLARAMSFVLWLSFAVLIGAPLLHAQTEPQAARTEARERFDRGLKRYAEGDYAGALAELERAQALVPNEVVLFNIGLVYTAQQRPVEAVAALDQVIAAPGTLPAERLAHARRVRDEQASRIAELAITSNVSATIELDGVQVGQTPLAAPLRVASGTHHIALLASGYIPARREVTLSSGRSEQLAVELVPTDKALAHLTIESPTPGAEVWIDGERVGRTPLPASVAVSPGTRVIELRRPGYVTARHAITIGEGASAQVPLALEHDPQAPSAALGRLIVIASEPEAHVTVDGRARGRYRASLLLPAGAHRVRIERGGFEPAERDVELPAGLATELRVTLAPTPETRLAHVESVRSQRLWGVIATVGGGVIAAAGGAVGIWAQASLPELERKLEAAEQSYTKNSNTDCDRSSGLVDTGMDTICVARINDAAARFDDRSLLRTIGFVSLGAGVAAATVGVVLLVTNDDEHKYERDHEVTPAIAATPWLAPDGAGASLSGRF